MLKSVKHKWEGARKENLEKHKLKNYVAGTLRDIKGNSFNYGCTTCVLCVKYYESEDNTHCISCPLYLANGKSRCDHYDEDYGSPYSMFTTYYDPEPMLALIDKAIELYEKN